MLISLSVAHVKVEYGRQEYSGRLKIATQRISPLLYCACALQFLDLVLVVVGSITHQLTSWLWQCSAIAVRSRLLPSHDNYSIFSWVVSNLSLLLLL